MFAHSWLVFPVVLAVLCLGCGLLLARAAGPSLPRVLLLPAGLAVVVALAVLLTFMDATAPLTTPALVAVALAGFALAGRDRLIGLRPSRAWLWPAIAAALPFAAIAAPVVLTGEPGFTGYGRIVDLAFQMDLAAYLVEHGRSLPEATDSSVTALADRLLDAGYPGGAQAALAGTAGAAGLDVMWAWQPFIAWLGAMLGLSLYGVLGRAIDWAPGRAVAAGVAAQPTILYSYALSSGIKELGAAVFFASAVALVVAFRERAGAPASVGGGLPLVVVAAAAFGTFTVGILPWLVVLLAVAVGGPLILRHRGARALVRPRAIRTALISAALAGLVAAPAVVAAFDVASLVAAGGPGDLGNLAAPVPPWAVLGPWLTQDHRYPLDVPGTELPTAVLAAVVALLAAFGLARAVATRDVPLVAAGIAAAVALAVVLAFGGAWVELKAIVVSAPIAVALAFAGAAALRRPRAAALAAGAFVALSVLAGNALVYRGTTLAPSDRLAELEHIADGHDTGGRTLYVAFDEFAGYVLRDARASTPADQEPGEPERGLREGAPPGPLFSRDLDDYTLEHLDAFDQLVVRRDPTHSRPPSDFRLVGVTERHTVWRRDPGAPKVLSHVALPTGAPERTSAQCAQLQRALRAGGERARLAFAAAPEVTVLPLPPPPGWKEAGQDRLARGPGRSQVEIRIPRDGAYRLWLGGSFGREVLVSLAGRPFASVRWQESYPGQYEPLGATRLTRGTHLAEIVRGGGSLLPGTADDLGPEGATTRIGPLAVAPADDRRGVRYAPASRAMAICRGDEALDWLEVVAGR
jgi:hypothetical protein